MDDLDLKQYEKLGPFEIKDFLAKVASKSAEEASIVVSQRRSRQPELGRHRAARGVLPARTVRDHRVQARARSAAGRGRHAQGTRRREPARGMAEQARRHARCAVPAGDGAVGREEIRLRRRRLRARAGRFDHRRPLPGAGSHARAQRARSSTNTSSGRCAEARGRRASSRSTRSRAAPPRCATSSSR